MLKTEHNYRPDCPSTVRTAIVQAEEWLRKIVGGSDFLITAQWEVIPRMSSNEHLVVLQLRSSDLKLSPSGIFTVDELNDQKFSVPAFRELYLALLHFKSAALVPGNAISVPSTE